MMYIVYYERIINIMHCVRNKIYYLLAIVTCAPNSESMVAMPAPSPDPPPVINATFPSNVPLGSIGLVVGLKKSTVCFLCCRADELNAAEALRNNA